MRDDIVFTLPEKGLVPVRVERLHQKNKFGVAVIVRGFPKLVLICKLSSTSLLI
jgi:hypothetical protein